MPDSSRTAAVNRQLANNILRSLYMVRACEQAHVHRTTATAAHAAHRRSLAAPVLAYGTVPAGPECPSVPQRTGNPLAHRTAQHNAAPSTPDRTGPVPEQCEKRMRECGDAVRPRRASKQAGAVAPVRVRMVAKGYSKY